MALAIVWSYHTNTKLAKLSKNNKAFWKYKLEQMKIGFGLRAFIIYFLILGTLIWFTLDNAIERLNDGMRQSAESVLVDGVQILAGFIEDQLQQQQELSTEQFERVFERVHKRQFEAQIYQIIKTSVDSQVYVTDQRGIIIYDSTGLDVGEDFSQWRDVKLTLEGQYGARTSFLDSQRKEPDDAKGMIVAAPILQNGETIGVVSLIKPINGLEGHLLTETNQLKRFVFALLALALLLGYFLSLWFSRSLKQIADYANDMASGKNVSPPTSRDSRLSNVSDSISNLRKQLDGKEYIENYIHGLTHELKTPLTSIRGAIELIDEDMPESDRKRFFNNISRSNRRMSRLVDRMLSLAKLESETDVQVDEFDLLASVRRLIEERDQVLNTKKLSVELPKVDKFSCYADQVLLSQAIANLLDNAISFSKRGSTLTITMQQEHKQARFSLTNEGESIPDFAQDKLFDRFFSLPRENQDGVESKSTGLGLSFVKQIMKLHQGTISVRNSNNGVVANLSWPNQLNREHQFRSSPNEN